MDFKSVAQNFPHVHNQEVEKLIEMFRTLDPNGEGEIDNQQFVKFCKSSDINASFDDITSAVREVSGNSGTVTFESSLKAISKLKEKGTSSKQQKITRLGGATDSTQHSINEDEKEQFVTHINHVLAHDKDISSRLPIATETTQIFQECKDGLLLCKLINDAVPETIDERVLNIGKKLNAFQMTENNNVVINSAKAIGCSVVNIGSQDLIEGREHLILGLIWQVIKIGLLSKITLQNHPELYRLLENGETIDDLLKLPADVLLLRWFNFQLKEAKWHRTVTNFSGDIKDSENYIVLLNKLCPDTCSKEALKEQDLTARAEKMLVNAEKIGCYKFVNAKTICSGNAKLNLAFVANLFNHYPGLTPLSREEMVALDEKLFGAEGDREARAFALWLNSLGVEPFVNSIFADLRDGLILLQAFDKVKPGCVNWGKVNKNAPLSRFKCIENTNTAVELGKTFKFSLVGIQGADLTDGNKILTLGLVWQLMREHIVQILKSLSSNGQDIKDADMINWANETVKKTGKSSTMSTFKDSSLKTGVFFLDLLNGIRKGIVNFDLVTAGQTEDEAKMNAKYAISVARKLGATIFLLPEDIYEVKPKMILTFVGALMAIEQGHK